MATLEQNPYSSLDEDNFNTQDGYSEEDDYSDYDAEAEWEESKEQLSSLFSLVVFPFVGKWLGKKFSFWVWSRYLTTTPLASRYSILSTDLVNSFKKIA
ncbi:uncharacterized protein EV154DRAFT_523070 [Mucor mucedo]|uniref:Uncharacterized protein n=1 Tax=Mucor saturninus TaxID=64648 RepID=A0A8H7R1T3_9FUNG|nr:uncharacterized protein EV154DRAFT_523070 [Mucor mucedo]KAG2202907.1 hypothetical protein INT47_008939 [Mucor saturninus]KAI7882088.1 hypothetical protein EV154DRAFT_523070 [Mucor mucedo]